MRVYGVGKVTGDSRLQSDVLESLSDARRYRRWLADLVRPHLGPNPVEIGSGNGDYALEWAPDVESFAATEADESRYRTLAARFAGHPVIGTRCLLLPDDTAGAASRTHSAAVALNVLEHIADHVAALKGMADLVRPGGAVVIIVPAFPSAMSRFDRAIGHERRYTRATLTAAMVEAGLRPTLVRYVNPIGLLGWYVATKALGMTPRNGALLRGYDRTVIPVARFLDRVPAPFGQSVFAVGQVT